MAASSVASQRAKALRAVQAAHAFEAEYIDGQKREARRVVPANKTAFDAIGDIDRIVAFINGAISTIKCADTWETDKEPVETVYLLEAAVERAGKVRAALDCGLTEAGHD